MVYVLDTSFCIPHVIPDEKTDFIECFFFYFVNIYTLQIRRTESS
jgi:hypothetical protein